MRRLYVLRHAKSSWAVPGARDFDRRLNERGLQDVKKLGDFMLARNHKPELVLCSSAERTKETFDNLKFALSVDHKVTFVPDLYSGDLDSYYNAIRTLDTPLSVMIIGHNPMCGNFAASMASTGDEASLERIRHKYPTCTLSVLDFEMDSWRDLAPGTGRLEAAITPSKLV